LEIGGAAIYGSINYERTVYEKEKFKIGGRIGLGTYRLRDFTGGLNPDLLIPCSVHFIYGRNHNVELSVGNTFATIVRTDIDYNIFRENSNSFTPFLGYRFEAESGFVLRAGYSPYFSNYYRLNHWGAVSAGYRF
jgi:hypothetical protein